MSESLIVCSDLSFSWPDDTPVFADLSWALGPGHTGLIAPNGAGKSTLLKLIAGQLRPSAGGVTVSGVLGYLPQNLSLVGELTVAHVLGVAPVLAALASVESGDASEEHFVTIGSDWDIEDRTRAQLDRLGLGDVALDRRLGTLSGGQVVSLGLAGQLLEQPDVLLLDEPTNNLDAPARHRLYRVLDEWSGALLVVSHDRALLERMDQIAELDAHEVRTFGGNVTEYTEAVRVARDAAQRAVRGAETEVKREKRDRQLARERAERRANNAARNVSSAGLPKILAGARKRNAQELAGRSDTTHESRVKGAEARLAEANRALPDDATIRIELPETEVPAGRTVFLGERLNVSLGGRSLFAPPGIDLAVRGPERIALSGPNGAGKSTLLRLIAGELRAGTGAVTHAAGRVAYLSQRLDLLDLGLGVLDNLAAATPGLPQNRRMHLLAQFLFTGDRIHLPIAALSGGERLRATLACVLFAQPAPQLVLLDEPTNNLDLVSVGRLESALAAYRGAFVVVSHDERFLAGVGVTRWLRLHQGRLSEAGSPA
ncbi:MAG TPA: ABC-F family ATP-binding cassette domain-containing protein [Pseudonocardia sp.]|nr:ABC-F family ATP-binding cassette domain-containing protein [Pseudonocardia sp.]